MTLMHKTSIVIWTEEDTSGMDLVDLATIALCEQGARCSKQECVAVPDHEADPDWEYSDPTEDTVDTIVDGSTADDGLPWRE